MWICRCGQRPATTFYALWMWRRLPKGSRWVANNLALLCDDCAAEENDPRYHRNPDEQFLPVRLTASTREALIRQVLAQVIDEARGYVPRTDVREAVGRLTKT